MSTLHKTPGLFVAIALLALFEGRSTAASAGPASRPNLVIILVDDAGYADFPGYADRRPRTPNIDQLAREGIRFSQYYANAPICSPSRLAMVTGQFPARWGITSYIAARQENARRGIRNWLDPVAPSLARMLQSGGYATGHFGKWHLGGGRDVGEAPLITEYGFEQSLTQFEGLGDRVLPLVPGPQGKRTRKMELGVASERLGRGNVEWLPRDQVTQAFVRRALDFMTEADAAGQPFFVNLWPDDVHTPLHPPRELEGDGSKRDRYLGVLENMDRQLGELFDYIRSRDSLRDNTLVIVTSDNGHEAGAGSAGELRGSKGGLYEGGIREPLVVWGPGLVDKSAAGSTNADTVISAVDVVASLLAIAGRQPPENVDLDGEDLSESILGRIAQIRTRPLFWVRPPDRGEIRGEDMPDLAIREGQWKLLLERDGTRPQLYDLAADRIEGHNVAELQPDIVKQLSDTLLDWYADIDPQTSAP